MKKKKKKKGKGLLLFLFIVYIVFFLRWVYDRGVPTDIIKYGNIDYTVKAQGVLLRDEVCYALDIDGKYIPSLSEGDLVAKDTEIAVAMKEEVLSLFDQRQTKAKELFKIRSQTIAEKEGLQVAAVSGITTDLKQELSKLMELSAKNKTIGTEEILSNIQDMITDRYIASSAAVSMTPQEKLLQDQISVLDSAIADNRKVVYASQSGIVSYKIDEMEQFLRFEDYSTVSLKQIDALRREYEKSSKAEPFTVSKNRPFVKVLTDFRYRILAETDPETIKRLKEATVLQIRILNKGITVNAVMEYTGTDPDGRSFAVFYSDEKHEVLSDQRFLNIEIICDAYRGFKVPLTALFDVEENKAKIIIVENSFASFKDVEIIAKNHEYAIIKSSDVNLYDIFALDPKNIKEGQVLN